MSNPVELKTLSKALKLSGILDHLDVRLMVPEQRWQYAFAEGVALDYNKYLSLSGTARRNSLQS